MVWLFLGGSALMEQLTLVPETSPQDEQALAHLALGLKPDRALLPEETGRTISARYREASLALSPEAGHPQATRGFERHHRSSLALHQILSVYRI